MGAAPSRDKTVVIVGAGYAGVHLAKELDSYVNVVLVGAQPKFHLYLASSRSLVDKEFAPKTFFSYDKLMKHGRFVHGTATEVEPTCVTVARPDGSSEKIAADYVVIATGATFTAPIQAEVGASAADTLAKLQGAQAAIAGAQRIVIVGGGPVGTELAAEIATDFPSKSVTLIHSGTALLSDSLPHLAPDAAAALSATVTARLSSELRVKLLLGSRAVAPKGLQPGTALLPGPVTVETEGGGSAEGDLLLWVAGAPRPNNAALKPHLSGVLDGSGRVKVTPTLEVEGHPRLFAIGDIKTQAGVAAAKRDGFGAHYAMAQAQHVAKSIKGLLKGRPAAVYPGGMSAAMITLGRHRGAGVIGRTRLPSWMIARFKSRHMLTDMMGGVMGVAGSGAH